MNASAPLPVLAQRLRAGETLFMSWCGIPDPSIPEDLVREGFDASLLDMQHGAITVESAISGIAHVGLAGHPALVRIPVGEFATASRMLDAGAAGIVAPMINSVADARQLAAFTKFPPLGERSWGPRRALALANVTSDEYFVQANAMHLTIAMIETREALAALDDILGVPGIDGVLVGPSDLSITLSGGAGVNAQHPLVEAALDHIAARCAALGKVACAFCMTGARGNALAKRGFRLMSLSTDSALLRIGAKMELADARKR